MIIGIDASRAFSGECTGIEEYSFQVIKNLANDFKDRQVVLYVRGGQSAIVADCPLPTTWKIKVIRWPFFWTQIGLSLEMLLHPVDVLFIPSHVIPFIHPQNTVVTIHGLEYEFFPEGYSFWERLYMRWSIKASCRWAKKIIAVSQNTKKDLVELYKVSEDKISVIYEGVSASVIASEDENDNSNRSAAIPTQQSVEQNNKFSEIKNEIATSFRGETPRNDSKSKYLLFIGRLEARKNIVGIIKAFEILKEKYKIPYQLMLAGKFGHGEGDIKKHLSDSSYKSDILCLGFVSEEEKQELLKNAEVFLFPSFYEGFGLPILEAQCVGVPVITSNISSMREISTNYLPAGRQANLGTNVRIESCLLINPNSHEQIAEATYRLISDKVLRDDIIKKGYENVKRFSWEKCAKEIAELLQKMV